MSEEDVNMNEFLRFPKENECFQTSGEDKFFNRERTLKLLELYQVYKKQIGTFHVKSMKKLSELVAKDISNHYKITISFQKCENRFKVLERNYKKIVDNNKKTGRGRIKTFEFENEMDEIFEKKKNLHPTLLLSSDGICRKATSEPLTTSEEGIPCISIIETENQIPNDDPSCSYAPSSNSTQVEAIPISDTPSRNQAEGKRKCTPSYTYQKRNNILLDLKNDLRSFYDSRDKREQEKLEIARKRLEEKQKKNDMLKVYVQFFKSNKNDTEKE